MRWLCIKCNHTTLESKKEWYKKMDMLVKLYAPLPTKVVAHVKIIRPLTADKSKVLAFIRDHFHVGWADETETAFSSPTVTCMVAVDDNGEILGFASYECTAKGFFGPTGVRKDMRGRGIGGALAVAALNGLRELGYCYGVIGGVAAENFGFYHACCGAEPIEGSEPGIYCNFIKG